MKMLRLLPAALVLAAFNCLAEDAAAQQPDASPAMLEFLQRGGMLVWPILLLALAGVALSIERITGLRRGTHLPDEFHKDIVHIVDTRGVDAGIGRCLDSKSSISRALYAALMRYGAGRQDMESAVLAECRRILFDLMRNIRMIGILAIFSILLGLLGLSLGLIEYFQLLAVFPTHSSAADAMVPLTLGLAASILLFNFYFMLKIRAENFVRDIEEYAIEAVVTLDRKARQSIRLIDDIEEQIPTKDMPIVKGIPPDLEKEFEEVSREGSGVKTSITTHSNLPIVPETPPKKPEGAGR